MDAQPNLSEARRTLNKNCMKIQLPLFTRGAPCDVKMPRNFSKNVGIADRSIKTGETICKNIYLNF
jgi:hypothetical protein